jgi:SAM-dependent methyltransferase
VSTKAGQLHDVPGEVYTADITSGRDLPARTYDVVMSIGVIEHFRDPADVVQRHINLLKPGGTLILQVPNLAGWVNQWLLRGACMQGLLASHNLAVMNKGVFRGFAQRFDLEVCHLEYAGGFDPGLMVYNHSYTSRWLRPPVFYCLWLLERLTRRHPRLCIGLNHSSFSMMLVGIFRRHR